MEITFVEVKADRIEELALLAHHIWHEFFTSILSLDQIDYMVDKFLSKTAIKEQMIINDYRYYFICFENNPIGFVGFHLEERRLFLSKLYLVKEYRGKGIASQTFQFLEDLCIKHHKKTMYLTVNKYNEHTIKVYEKKGFVKVDALISDIGHGYIMDDFIMEKVILKECLCEEHKMIHGLYHLPSDSKLSRHRLKAKTLLFEYNDLHPEESNHERYTLLKQLFRRVGKKPCIEVPFKCDYGCNIVIGHYFYANSHCTILDSARVLIGNEVLFGPNVGLYTTKHPLDYQSRKKGYEIAKPITIGNHVWLGANVVVLAGVTIGDRCVIGAGSVVTKDIPADSLAYGNPCVVIRKINQDETIRL